MIKKKQKTITNEFAHILTHLYIVKKLRVHKTTTLFRKGKAIGFKLELSGPDCIIDDLLKVAKTRPGALPF